MWKTIFIIFIIAVAAKVFIQYYPAYKTDMEIKKSTETFNAGLPKVLNNTIRLESMQYSNHVLHMAGVVLASVDVDDSKKAVIESKIKEMYCGGTWKIFADAKVGMEVSFKFESVFYRNIEWLFKVSPETCK